RRAGFAPANLSSVFWRGAQPSRWAISSAWSASGGGPVSSCRNRSAGGQEEVVGMMDLSAAGSFRLQLPNLLGQPRQDPAPGHVNSPDRQAQLGADVGGAHALDGGLPKRLPGLWGEVVLDLGGGDAEELLLILLFPGSLAIGPGVRHLGQAKVGVGIAAADRLQAAALQEPGQLVARDPVE